MITTPQTEVPMTSAKEAIREGLRLLIVDDHAMVREGLEAMLGVALAPVWIRTAANASQTQQICQSFKPHVVLLDVRMPGADGFSALESLVNGGSSCRFLLLSASATPAEVKLARRLGAAGYLSKAADSAQVVQAIERVLRGGTCFPADVGNEEDDPSGLSARELDVIRHLGRGLSNLELGRVLGISESTVKAHLRSAFAKLQVTDRAEAVARAYQLGILAPGS